MADVVPLTLEQRAEVTRALADYIADTLAGVREKLTPEQLCNASRLVNEVAELIAEVDEGTDKLWREVIFIYAFTLALAAPEPMIRQEVGKRGRPKRKELLSPKERERLKKKLNRPSYAEDSGRLPKMPRAMSTPDIKRLLSMLEHMRATGDTKYKAAYRAAGKIPRLAGDDHPNKVRKLVYNYDKLMRIWFAKGVAKNRRSA